jgi:hypothetical protein
MEHINTAQFNATVRSARAHEKLMTARSLFPLIARRAPKADGPSHSIVANWSDAGHRD